MPQVQKILKYARDLADQLDRDVRAEAVEFGIIWGPVDHAAETRIAGRTVAVLDFFRQYAGARSDWSKRAISAYENPRQSQGQLARVLSGMLRAWTEQVDAGTAEIAGSQAWAEVGMVSTDVMGHVRRLLEDRDVHPAAPIVLCGTALEIALRAVAEARGVPLPAQPTMNKLIGALRAADLLSVQDVKDLEAAAGLRNQAAHGHFDALSGERAGLMEQQTNILLRRLAGLQVG